MTIQKEDEACLDFAASFERCLKLSEDTRSIRHVPVHPGHPVTADDVAYVRIREVSWTDSSLENWREIFPNAVSS